MTASQSPDDTRRGVVVEAVTIGATTGAYGVSFGALSITSGLSVWQTMAPERPDVHRRFAVRDGLRTRGRRFGGGCDRGSGLLGLRNLFYGLRIRPDPAAPRPCRCRRRT